MKKNHVIASKIATIDAKNLNQIYNPGIQCVDVGTVPLPKISRKDIERVSKYVKRIRHQSKSSFKYKIKIKF